MGANLATFGQRNKPFCKYPLFDGESLSDMRKFIVKIGYKLVGIFYYLRFYLYLCGVLREYRTRTSVKPLCNGCKIGKKPKFTYTN